MNKNEILIEAVDFFGKDKQMVVAIEEMAELTQELSKQIIGHKNKSRNSVIEEYTDVFIMLRQLAIIFEIRIDEIKEIENYKLWRIKRYIEDMKGGDE
jgi:NTP pyrophosphatase (non-canonical NTP hydrolase)